jgi:hypothetical protein
MFAEHDALGLGGPANNRAAITQRAQVTNLLRVRAWNLELHWLSARRQEQRIKFAIAAIRVRFGTDEIERFVQSVQSVQIQTLLRDLPGARSVNSRSQWRYSGIGRQEFLDALFKMWY